MKSASFACLFLFGVVLMGEAQSNLGPITLLDEPAIEFDAVDLDGQDVRLSDLRGKVVLINFWGVWCVSCREEIPELIALDREFRNRGLVVLGADWGDEPAALPPFVEEFGMSYPVLLDDGLAERYGVIVFPTSVVIDQSGQLRVRVEGFLPERFEAMTAEVERLLGDSK